MADAALLAAWNDVMHDGHEGVGMRAGLPPERVTARRSVHGCRGAVSDADRVRSELSTVTAARDTAAQAVADLKGELCRRGLQ